MVDLATQLIKRQTGKYNPAHENRLRAMIDAKPLEPEERVHERSNVIDLVFALKKSLEEAEAAEVKAEKTPKGRRPKGPSQPRGQRDPETGLIGLGRLPALEPDDFALFFLADQAVWLLRPMLGR
jgi:DNA end-binding protein Ku